MPDLLLIMKWVSLASIGLGTFTTIFVVGAQPLPALPRLGRRGLKRRQALEASALRYVDSLVRLLSARIENLPIPKMRKHIALQIRLAGDLWGLNANEFLALCCITGVGSIPIAFFLATQIPDYAPHIFIFIVIACAYLPYSKLTEQYRLREKAIHRVLPGAVELLSLCMGAGLDFPGAMRQIVSTAADRREPLYEEFSRILQELELGRTRKQALLGFADRVPSDIVKDFVSAVVQAEEKGNPLAKVLRVQAQLQRARRSSLIEEQAGKAAVKMTLPSVLLIMAVLIAVVGPIVLDGALTGGM